ncbi:4'-phosphopantetheinyl transferase family protein [Aquimarina agarilytica]|uniref:4'-phosphopantetheinyl transferase family protein n=1 Tax=Aquimarina agarilytica TaxID=1087449 RepID=UPI0002885780|nr:4'-phosphopantetheinyl transferase superfamily protein [Aquimarina agarilytica]
MPLYKSIAADDETHILIWKITETENELSTGISLGKNSTERVLGMKSEMHRKAYLSVRHLLAIAQYTDEDLTYNEVGKPKLSDGVCVSITHSHEFSAIILSAKPVGIDIEKQRIKIETIANKFVSEKEKEWLSKHQNNIKSLTVIWGAKESIYKLYGQVGLSFKQHIELAPFNFKETFTRASVHFKEEIEFFDVFYLEFEEFTCVYTF